MTFLRFDVKQQAASRRHRNEIMHMVAEAVRAEPGITQAQLIEKLGVASGNISITCRRLLKSRTVMTDKPKKHTRGARYYDAYQWGLMNHVGKDDLKPAAASVDTYTVKQIEDLAGRFCWEQDVTSIEPSLTALKRFVAWMKEQDNENHG